jgi:fructose/tagatose bisphosphate aldolase
MLNDRIEMSLEISLGILAVEEAGLAKRVEESEATNEISTAEVFVEHESPIENAREHCVIYQAET